MSTNEVVIASACRTAVGTMLGAVADVSTIKLGTTVVSEVIRRAGIQPDTVDEVILGSVLEGMPVIVLLAPLLFPVARALHINDVHYAIVLILAMGIGLFAPPIGVGLYTACGVGGVPMERVVRPIAKYLAIVFVALLLLAFIPAITLAVPRWLGVL